MNILTISGQNIDSATGAVLINNLFTEKDTVINLDGSEKTLKNEFVIRKDSIDYFDRVFIIGLELNEDEISVIDRHNVVVIDHHLSHFEKKSFYKNATTIIEEFTSVSALIIKTFNKKHTFSTALQKLAVFADDYITYRIEYREALELNSIYRSYNRPYNEKFIEAFKNGIREYNIHEKNAIKLYFKRFKEQIQDAKVFTGTLKDYSIVATFADFGINDVAHYWIKKYNCDIGIVVLPKANLVCFRRKPGTTIDVRKIAEVLCDGDGTPSASGGKITDRFQQFTKKLTLC